MKIEGISLLASALCDLKCKYCYISQDESQKKVQEDLYERFKSTNFFDSILPLLDDPKDIKTIGLWGLEPTKSLSVLSERFDYIFETFPNIKDFSFSSNFQGDPIRIINFIKKIGKERKVMIGIQISLDGMPEINDLNRGTGSGENIIRNAKSLMNQLIPVLEEQQNISVSMSDKGTFSATILEKYAADPELLKKNFRFMEQLYSEFYAINTLEPRRFNMNYGGINFETPYPFTQEHGIMLVNLMKTLEELKEKENLHHVYLPFFGKLERTIKFSAEFNNKHLMFSCGASKGNISMGVEEEFFSFCHRDFFPAEGEGPDNYLKDFYSIRRDLKDLSRQNYLTNCYTNFPKLHIEQIIIMCKELAYAGLIDKEYMDYETAYIMAMYLTSESCPSEALAEFCSPYVKDMGYIKLMGNGAFKFLIERVMNER
jgi:hypothetical protein